MKSWRWAVPGLPATLLVVSPASAQVGEALIVQPQIEQGYDRGRNLSVDEQPRPDYTALGVRFGGVVLFPRVEVGAGGTTNTYLAPGGGTASPFAYIRPSARLTSDWSRHQLELSGSATLRNYIGESRRNERTWNLAAQGQLQIRREFTIDAEATSSRSFENVFSGEVAPTVAALSRVDRNVASVQATYTGARTRGFVVADHTDLHFKPVALLSGGTRDQSDRDRGITRLTGQLEYARSPSISLFGQLSGSQTRYDRELLNGGSNFDSKAARALVGANFDIAGRIRGTVGVGYSIRDFDASDQGSIRGLSVETRVQMFPLTRLTLTATAQRNIEDAAVDRNRQAFWNTRVTGRADYEVLRNLIVNATASYSRQRYFASPLKGEILGAGVGGRYLASRRVNLLGSLSYGRRSSNNAEVVNTVSEGRVELGVAYQL